MTEKVLTEAIIPSLKGKMKNIANESMSGIQDALNKTVQLDTVIGEDASSTVSIEVTTGALGKDTTSVKPLPLPVASETSAGVVNPATYKTIFDTAEKLDSMLGAAVTIDDLPADADDAALTSAWKAATGKDEAVNGASILDTANNKTWTYYSNAAKWVGIDNNTPTIEVSQFTNEAAGIIKGDNTTDGKVQAESDGTGSVKGWDTVKSDIAANTSSISALEGSKQDKLEFMTVEEFNAAWEEATSTSVA